MKAKKRSKIMQVYVLYKSIYDFCNEWEDVVGIYLHKDKANWAKEQEEKLNEDGNTSYYVQEFPVHTSTLE